MNNDSLPMEKIDGAGWLTNLRITGVNIHLLRAGLKRRFGWSLNWTAERTATLVEVTTNAGLSGWGDGWWGEERLRAHPGLVIGRSPFEVEAIFEDLRTEPGHQTRAGECVAGGLDTALWDLCGKALGRPVCELLGGRRRDRVEPYLTALYRQDWPDLCEGLAEEARGWKNRGWRAMKMKIGYGPDTDIRAVRAVRAAIGDDVQLGVDSNCAYDVGTAVALGRRLEEFNPMWWEEPILADDLRGYARLGQSLRIPIASGETLPEYRLVVDYIQPRLVDIVQPDLETVGCTGGRRLLHLCWLNHVRFVPHNWGTALRTAATLQLMATAPVLSPGMHAPPVTMEFDQTESPFRDALLKESIVQDASGCLSVPRRPGVGVDVVPEAVREFRVERIEIR